jgi:RTX calcium-binding nonapeptide repeat (4 copies)
VSLRATALIRFATTFLVSLGGVAGAQVTPALAGPSGCEVVQIGTGSDETLLGTAAGDLIIGEGGRDRLKGLESADCLRGESAADVLVGDAGTDLLVGGPGRDRIRAVDGERDRVRCGAGRDRARVDAGDRVAGCERVRKRGRPTQGGGAPQQPEPDSQEGRLGFNVHAPNSYSADLAWTSAPAGTDHLEIYRDGRLIDRVPATTRTYTDHLLWQSTSYKYSLRALDAQGNVLEQHAQTISTRAQQGAFPRPYQADSPWNTPIGPDPEIDPNSNAIVAYSLVPFQSYPHLTRSASWGLGLAYANPSSRNYVIGCTLYACTRRVEARIPAYATPNAGSDGKLTIIEDPSTPAICVPTTQDPCHSGTEGTELDMWQGAHDTATDTWSASWRGVTDVDGWGFMCMPGEHCNGPNAAGNTGLAGVIRPEEIAQGHIDHALQLSGVSGHVRANFVACPATHWDGTSSDPRAIPQGARIQLDPRFDVDAQPWLEWKKVIARALQEYGAIIDEGGSGSLGIMAESNVNRGYDAWRRAGMRTTTGSRSLSALPWDRIRVLKITRC